MSDGRLYFSASYGEWCDIDHTTLSPWMRRKSARGSPRSAVPSSDGR